MFKKIIVAIFLITLNVGFSIYMLGHVPSNMHDVDVFLTASTLGAVYEGVFLFCYNIAKEERRFKRLYEEKLAKEKK